MLVVPPEVAVVVACVAPLKTAVEFTPLKFCPVMVIDVPRAAGFGVIDDITGVGTATTAPLTELLPPQPLIPKAIAANADNNEIDLSIIPW